MYAIVEIAGQQYKVRKDQKVYVHRLQGNEGDAVSFEKVLLTDDDGSVSVGAPVIEGIKVDAKIVSHLKGDKVIVFKKKRRKGYQKKNGHRQYLSLIEITGIGKNGGSTKTETASKKEEAPKAEAKSENNGDLSQLKGVGPKKAEALAAAGYTMEKIAKLDDAGIEKMANDVDGVTVENVKNDGWVETAKEIVNQ